MIIYRKPYAVLTTHGRPRQLFQDFMSVELLGYMRNRVANDDTF